MHRFRRPPACLVAALFALCPALVYSSESIRLSVVSQVWSPEGRTLPAVTARLDEAARDKADLVLLPQECVLIDGETIPGPVSGALAKEAAEHNMYVVGNLREKDGDTTYVASFLLDRAGKLAGKYRKSHKMPDEERVLGDDLPVFPTDFGPVAMRVGTDRFFPEIDMVYAAKGARAILWSQAPEPVEDEHLETDFGRIAVRICADEWNLELDRVYAVKGADVLFTPTQSWGPDALFRELRDTSRAMDGGFFLVECTHPSSEARHRSRILDPAGMVVAAAEYRKAGVVTTVIDLDADRPQRYLRVYDPHTPGGYLPEFQPDRMPRAKNDLRETVRASRRPALYSAIAPK